MTIKRILIALAALVWLGFLSVVGAAYLIGIKQAAGA